MKKAILLLMSIVLIALLCSCATLQIASQFTLSEPVICLTMPEGYRWYEANVSRQCNQNFPFWIYLELHNITVRCDADGCHHFTNRLLEIVDSNGITVMSWPVPEYRRTIEPSRNETSDQVYTWYWIFPAHSQSNLLCETYTAYIWIEDIYSGEADEVSVEFTIMDGRDI